MFLFCLFGIADDKEQDRNCEVWLTKIKRNRRIL
nr:MAG TPA: hypothetical protein [Caudoviricetes sp.]